MNFKFKAQNKEKLSLEKLLDSKYDKIVKDNKRAGNLIDDFSFDDQPKKDRKARFNLKNEMLKEQQIDALDKELMSMHKKSTKNKRKKQEIVIDTKGHQLLKEAPIAPPTEPVVKKSRKLKPEKKAVLEKKDNEIVNMLKKQVKPVVIAPVVLEDKKVEKVAEKPEIALAKPVDTNMRSLKNSLFFAKENQMAGEHATTKRPAKDNQENTQVDTQEEEQKPTEAKVDDNNHVQTTVFSRVYMEITVHYWLEKSLATTYQVVSCHSATKTFATGKSHHRLQSREVVS